MGARAWLSICAALACVGWLGARISGAQESPPASAAPAEADEGDPLEGVLRLDFDAAHARLRALAEGGGPRAGWAERLDAFLLALAGGDLERGIDALARLHEEDEDFESGALLARLASLAGDDGRAVALARELVASGAPEEERLALAEVVLGSAPLSQDAAELARAALAIDPWSPTALAHALTRDLARRSYDSAAESWRRLHLADLPMAQGLVGGATDDVAAALARSSAGDLAAALDARGWILEGTIVRATSGADYEMDERAMRCLRFRRTLLDAWRGAFRRGLAGGKAKRALIEAEPELMRALDASSRDAMYAALRDELGTYFLLASSDPLSLGTEALQILRSSERELPREIGAGEVRVIVTGPALFQMSRVLAPLTGGAGSKDLYRPDWPGCAVLHLGLSLGAAREAWRVFAGASTDPSADLPSMLDPSLPLLSLSCAYAAGNQGNACFAKARAIALAEAGRLREDCPALDPRSAFVLVWTGADLEGSLVHEMQHVADGRAGAKLERSAREQRAFLTELELAPPIARLDRLGVVATGGDPAASGDAYQAANLAALCDLVRELAKGGEIAPEVDRARNLQAQLDRLSADDVAALAAAARARDD